jgi:arylamine N-acetyltransferase
MSGSSSHPDPHFLIKDQAIFVRFLRVSQIDPRIDRGDALLAKLCAVFSRIPYENLTKIIKSDMVISPGSAKRLPDEVIEGYLRYGTGGTCFSLTAAFIAILNALDIEAHPVLGDRHYGTDTHCALVFSQDADLFLLDPGYLINKPTRLPTVNPVTFSTGFNTIELRPHEGGRKVDLVTILNNDRRYRLTYKITPVDGPTFGKAWERSFAWEMMTYPVLTRYSNGIHHYLQGNMLRIRVNERATKHVLSPDEEYDFISKTLGINKRIITQAFSVV